MRIYVINNRSLILGIILGLSNSDFITDLTLTAVTLYPVSTVCVHALVLRDVDYILYVHCAIYSSPRTLGAL